MGYNPACRSEETVSNQRIEAIVRGRVQGVAFRHHTQVEANRLKLTGWVANRPDGTVRVVAEGPESALRRFATWLEVGPSAAWVENADIRWMMAANEFHGFEIRY
jgi:acylphosphatase